MIKISVLGDIMCEWPFFNAASSMDGKFDFSGAFDGIKGFLKESDFIIGNLETPVAGQKLEYTKRNALYSFNTPPEFLNELKSLGVDLLLTANNHCVDRGIEGLFNTIDELDARGIKHTGTYKNESDDIFYHRMENYTFSVISCTASTNAGITKCAPGLDCVNLLSRQDINTKKGRKAIKSYIANQIISPRVFLKLKEVIGIKKLMPIIDDRVEHDMVDNYLVRLVEQIERAKQNSDFVIVCPHMGGQFNLRPGKFSERVMECISEAKPDCVIASHPHILQKIEVKNGIPCFYSIGNVTMSMCSNYIIHDNHPDLGIIVNIYINPGKSVEYTYSITKIIEDANGFIRVYMLYDLIKNSSGSIEKGYIDDFNTAVNLLGMKEFKTKIIPVPEIRI